MFPNSAKNLPVGLSLDEDYDENKDLKEFYESNLSCLCTCPMNLISYVILRKIALKLIDTEGCREDWRIYATEMGIDNDKLAEIKAGARVYEELEILFAMDKIIRNYGNFGNIIKGLLNTTRFDVLKKIEPFVRDVLLPQILPTETSDSAVTCKNENDVEKQCFIKTNSVSLGEYKCELNSFQQHSIKGYSKNGLKNSNSLKCFEKSLGEIKNPSAPEEEKLKVLIPHAESENDLAEQLSADFKKENIIPITLTQVNNLTRYNPENVLNVIFKEVDFIVPIVSSEFMEEIYPRNHDQYLESLHAQNNRKLYNLITNEYEYNRCINFRVRPVIVPGMSRRLIFSNPILSFSFRLDKEVSKLIGVLKETKDLNAQQMVQ